MVPEEFISGKFLLFPTPNSRVAGPKKTEGRIAHSMTESVSGPCLFISEAHGKRKLKESERIIAALLRDWLCRLPRDEKLFALLASRLDAIDARGKE